MLSLFSRVSVSAAILAVSVAVHLGFLGALVFAERRALPPSEFVAIDVDLVRPEELEAKVEPPQPVEKPKPPELPKLTLQTPPEPAKPPAQQSPARQSSPPNQSLPDRPPQPSSGSAGPEGNAEPPAEPKLAAKPPKPDLPQGGPAGEGKSRLTPEEIAALRAQIQKCWKLPVGIPGIVGLEVILRVGFGAKGQLAGDPVLLQAPASERGPMLVGIAMKALKECHPYKLPPAKYADWKTLDLKFTATGMTGLGAAQKLPQAKRN